MSILLGQCTHARTHTHCRHAAAAHAPSHERILSSSASPLEHHQHHHQHHATLAGFNEMLEALRGSLMLAARFGSVCLHAPNTIKIIVNTHCYFHLYWLDRVSGLAAVSSAHCVLMCVCVSGCCMCVLKSVCTHLNKKC